ncbi:hypothetical protein A9W99_09420 [Mycobacterium sp. 1164966.3]|uniref:hypothetical protein n=1 Tax=Mycobacterium sp. 1164966.3 TaxID=1856861 RepID=UPI000800F9C0|nr:hypothetical protein [Mycobacterium sp. 1164966.3]OBA82968.1 hypothetical protein A9W99_09420 [Mycobacterium sp. 1164966.3]
MARPTDITRSLRNVSALESLRPTRWRPALSAALAIALEVGEVDPPRPALSAALAIALEPDEVDPRRPALSAALAIALKLRG